MRKKVKISGLTSQNYEEGKTSKNIGMQTQTYEEKGQNYRDETQNYEKKVKILGCKLRAYEKKVKISGFCKLRIMRKKSKYWDANSDL